MRSRLCVALLLSGMIMLGACSGPSETTDEQRPATQEPAPTQEEERRASIADVETFDASAYPARAPEQTVEVTHDAPPRLLAGRADEGVQQTVEGFRIQVFSAQDQEAAREFRAQVQQWWDQNREQAPDDLFPEETPIVIEYSQPYYRVRLGAFADRDTASEALEFIQDTYEEAFLAQSTVTVVR